MGTKLPNCEFFVGHLTRGELSSGMQHSVQYGSQAYGLGLDEKLLSEYLNEKGYISHTVGKVKE